MLETWKIKVLIPAGACPVKLKSPAYDDVEEWVSALNKECKKNLEYQVSVFRYWAGKFFKRGSRDLFRTLENIALVTGSNDTMYTIASRSFYEKGRSCKKNKKS